MSSINDVAEAAGVSISTVSYALSGKRPVSEKTRARIEQAVHELGYQPNAGARMLAGRRTSIFALTEPLRTDTHAPTRRSIVASSATRAATRLGPSRRCSCTSSSTSGSASSCTVSANASAHL